MNGSYRWFVVFLLFLISMTNYIDRASISYAIHGIAQEFHLDSTHMGYILGAFGFGYLFTVLIGGILADKYGSHRVLTIASSLWVLATLGIGFAQTFLIIFLARSFLGIAEGPNFSCVTKTIKDWLTTEERNLALSMSLISVPLSLALSGPIITTLITHFNWRGMYFALALISLIFIPFWWFFYRDEPKQSPYVSSKELACINNSKPKKHLHTSPLLIKDILKNKTLMANNWGYFVFGFYLFFFMNWMPEYLNFKLNLKMTKVGLLAAIPWLTAMCMMIMMGWFTDYIYKKTGSLRYSRTYPIVFSHFVSGLALIPLFISHQMVWILICLSLSVGTVMSVNAVYYSVNIDVADDKAATAFGIMGLISSLSGIVAPIVTGWIVHYTSSFKSMFLIMLLLSLSSCFVLWLFHNKE